MSATVDPKLLKLVQEHVNQLSTDVNKMKFENQEEINNLWLVVKSIHEKLQVEHEKRFEKLERAQDVLQTNQDNLHHEIDAVRQQQSSTAVKVDNLVTNQDDLHQQMDALHQEQSSTAVKVDNLATNQDDLHHELDTLHQEQSSTAVKVDNLVTTQDDLHNEMNALHQEQSSTAVKVDNLVTNQDDLHHELDALHQEQSSTAVKVDRLQRVMELESHSNCGVSYGKYKLDSILPSSFPIFHFHSCSLECVALLHRTVGAYVSHQTACHNKLISRRTKSEQKAFLTLLSLILAGIR